MKENLQQHTAKFFVDFIEIQKEMMNQFGYTEDKVKLQSLRTNWGELFYFIPSEKKFYYKIFNSTTKRSAVLSKQSMILLSLLLGINHFYKALEVDSKNNHKNELQDIAVKVYKYLNERLKSLGDDNEKMVRSLLNEF